MIGLVVSLPFISLWAYGYFAPKYKAIERNIWEESNSRVNGAVQEISTRYIEYQRTEDIDEKMAICNYLRTSYPDITSSDVDDRVLWQFFSNCKYGGNIQ